MTCDTYVLLRLQLYSWQKVCDSVICPAVKQTNNSNAIINGQLVEKKTAKTNTVFK